MKNTLQPGARTQFAYRIPADKTVPHLFPEAHDFQLMPTVFATGFMVGLMEWTCMKVLEGHLDDGEGSLGTHIDVSHVAATVPGQTVTVDAECTEVRGRHVGFTVRAHDGLELIGEGRHERVVVPWERFEAKVNEKAKRARVEHVVGRASSRATHG
jgi:fluoroacetyl-CoA thioesterase